MRKNKRSSDHLATPQEPPVHPNPALLMAVRDASGRDPYKRLTGSALSAAAGFTVDSVRAVYGGSASTSKLLVWLEVFARGLLVQELAGTKTRTFCPAYKQVKAAVYFDPEFEQTQPTLVERFRQFANMPKSQWKRAAEPDRKAHDIKTLEHFRVFLLGIQRVPSNSLTFSARCRPPRRD